MTHLFDLETLAMAVGLAGAVLAAWGLLSSVRDLRDLTRSRLNGPLRIVAVGNLTRSAFRLATQSVSVVAGTYAVLSPAFSHEPGAAVLLCCIVVQSSLMLVLTAVDRMRRVQLTRLAENELAEDARMGRRKTDATLAAVCRELDIVSRKAK